MEPAMCFREACWTKKKGRPGSREGFFSLCQGRRNQDTLQWMGRGWQRWSLNCRSEKRGGSRHKEGWTKTRGRRSKGRRRALGERGGPQTPPLAEEKVMKNNWKVQGRAGTWPWMDGFSLLAVGPGLQDGMKGPDEPAASPLLHLKCGKRAQLWQELGLSCDACLAPGFQFIQGREGPILSSILETNEAPVLGGLRSWRLEFLRPSSEPFAGVLRAPRCAGQWLIAACYLQQQVEHPGLCSFLWAKPGNIYCLQWIR